MLRQPRLKGRRVPVSSALASRIEKAVEAEAKFFGCSKSFIVAVAVADALGVSLTPAERYKKVRSLRLVKRA